MIRIAARYLAPVFALGLLLSVAKADDTKPAAQTGTISGTVKTADDKPAANVKVSVYAVADASTAAPSTGDKNGTNKLQGKGHGKHAPAVATGTTDDQGAFKIENIPAGTYNVAAGGKGVGMGRQNNVEVKAGETATVNITLKAKKAA